MRMRIWISKCNCEVIHVLASENGIQVFIGAPSAKTGGMLLVNRKGATGSAVPELVQLSFSPPPSRLPLAASAPAILLDE